MASARPAARCFRDIVVQWQTSCAIKVSASLSKDASPEHMKASATPPANGHPALALGRMRRISGRKMVHPSMCEMHWPSACPQKGQGSVSPANRAEVAHPLQRGSGQSAIPMRNAAETCAVTDPACAHHRTPTPRRCEQRQASAPESTTRRERGRQLTHGQTCEPEPEFQRSAGQPSLAQEPRAWAAP